MPVLHADKHQALLILLSILGCTLFLVYFSVEATLPLLALVWLVSCKLDT